MPSARYFETIMTQPWETSGESGRCSHEPWADALRHALRRARETGLIGLKGLTGLTTPQKLDQFSLPWT